MQGKLILVVGQTGSGKGTLMSHLRATVPGLVFPISCTTRPMRPGEVNGQNYYFLTDEEFQTRAANNEFLEWVYTDGRRYGSLKSEILEPLSEGKTVVREMDIKGVAKLRALVPQESVRTIYIDAGTWDELKERIKARAPISDEELELRRQRYEQELPFKHDADIVVANPAGGLEKAKADFVAAVCAIQHNTVTNIG